jgi:hypothetical protein
MQVSEFDGQLRRQFRSQIDWLPSWPVIEPVDGIVFRAIHAHELPVCGRFSRQTESALADVVEAPVMVRAASVGSP